MKIFNFLASATVLVATLSNCKTSYHQTELKDLELGGEMVIYKDGNYVYLKACSATASRNLRRDAEQNPGSVNKDEHGNPVLTRNRPDCNLVYEELKGFDKLSIIQYEAELDRAVNFHDYRVQEIRLKEVERRLNELTSNDKIVIVDAEQNQDAKEKFELRPDPDAVKQNEQQLYNEKQQLLKEQQELKDFISLNKGREKIITEFLPYLDSTDKNKVLLVNSNSGQFAVSPFRFAKDRGISPDKMEQLAKHEWYLAKDGNFRSVVTECEQNGMILTDSDELRYYYLFVTKDRSKLDKQYWTRQYSGTTAKDKLIQKNINNRGEYVMLGETYLMQSYQKAIGENEWKSYSTSITSYDFAGLGHILAFNPKQRSRNEILLAAMNGEGSIHSAICTKGPDTDARKTYLQLLNDTNYIFCFKTGAKLLYDTTYYGHTNIVKRRVKFFGVQRWLAATKVGALNGDNHTKATTWATQAVNRSGQYHYTVGTEGLQTFPFTAYSDPFCSSFYNGDYIVRGHSMYGDTLVPDGF